MADLALPAMLWLIAALAWPTRTEVTSARSWSHAPSPPQDRGTRIFRLGRRIAVHRRGRESRRPSAAGLAAGADLADLVALGLEVGLPSDHALALATRSSQGPVPAVLTIALELSADLGAPVGPAARSAAGVLREQARALEATTTLAAGPRASMYLLTALPLVGPLALTALGLPLAEVYGRGSALALVGLGVALTGVGWLAARAILDRAASPTRLQRPRSRSPR